MSRARSGFDTSTASSGTGASAALQGTSDAGASATSGAQPAKTDGTASGTAANSAAPPAPSQAAIDGTRRRPEGNTAHPEKPLPVAINGSRDRSSYNPANPPRPEPGVLGNTQPTKDATPAPVQASASTGSARAKLAARPFAIKCFLWSEGGVLELTSSILSQTLDKGLLAGFPVRDGSYLSLASMRKVIPDMSSFSRVHKFCAPDGTAVHDEAITLGEYFDLCPNTVPTQKAAAPATATAAAAPAPAAVDAAAADPFAPPAAGGSSAVAAAPATAAVAAAATEQPGQLLVSDSDTPTLFLFFRSALPSGNKKQFDLSVAPAVSTQMTAREGVKATATSTALQSGIDLRAAFPTSLPPSAGTLTEDQWALVLRNCAVFYGWTVDKASRRISRAPKPAFRLKSRIQEDPVAKIPDYKATIPVDESKDKKTGNAATSSSAAGARSIGGASAPVQPTNNGPSPSTVPATVPSTAAALASAPVDPFAPPPSVKASTPAADPFAPPPNVKVSTPAVDPFAPPANANPPAAAADPFAPPASANPSAPAADPFAPPANARPAAGAVDPFAPTSSIKPPANAADPFAPPSGAKPPAPAPAPVNRPAAPAGYYDGGIGGSTVLPPKSNKNIPNFRTNDDSKIDVTLCKHSLAVSLAKNDFSSSSTEASIAGGAMGVQAGVSVGVAKSQETTNKSGRDQSSQTMVARYMFPRCDLLLIPDDLEPTPELAALLTTIKETKNIKALRKLQADYGQFFCQQLTLGARLLSTKIMSSDTNTSEEEKKEQFKVSVGVSVTSPYASASVKHEEEKGGSTANARKEATSNESNVFEACGGDTTLAVDPTAWASTVGPYQNWRVINRDGLSSLVDMIAEMDGYAGVQSWFVQAVPAINKYIALDESRRFNARFRLLSPTNSLSIPNYKNAAFYFGSRSDGISNPTVQGLGGPPDSGEYWHRQPAMLPKLDLFDPPRYRAPVIVGITDNVVGDGKFGNKFNDIFASVEWTITAPFSEALTHGARVVLQTVSVPQKAQADGTDNTPPSLHMVVFRNAQGVYLPGLSDRDEYQYWRILKLDGGSDGATIKSGDAVRLCWDFKDQTTGMRDYLDDVFGRRQAQCPAELADSPLYLKVPWPRFEPENEMTNMVLSPDAQTGLASTALRTQRGPFAYILQDLTLRIDTVDNGIRGDADDYLLKGLYEEQKQVAPQPSQPSNPLDIWRRIFMFGSGLDRAIAAVSFAQGFGVRV